MATYVYPSNTELQAVEQEKLTVLTADDPIFEILPMVDVDAHQLLWEQKDNYVGLQQIRGLNGQPGSVNKVGAKRYRVEPGVYGEFATINEEDLTARRQWGSWAAPVDISDLVMEAQDQLLSRRLDRIKYIGWTLITTGTFSVSNADGSVAHTDVFSLQTYNASTWATGSSATPLADFRAAALLGRGRGVQFNNQARAYMNATTANALFSNTNDADLYGKRVNGLANALGLGDTNEVLLKENLPRVEIYEGGYLDVNGTFQLFIPDNVVAIVGARPGGQLLGDYAMTRNASNPNLAPGPYTAVIDSAETHGRPPRTIEVHDGHNGGPRLYFPSAIIIMDVS